MFAGAKVRALLVESKSDTRAQIISCLGSIGLSVSEATSIDEALELLTKTQYVVVLVDFGSSGSGSLQIANRIKGISTIPVVAILKHKEMVDEQVLMLAGFDDYVTKPISDRILISRVNQQLNRTVWVSAANQNLISWGELSMIPSSFLFTVSGVSVPLTNSEFQFLKLLLEQPERVFTKEQILTAIGSFDGLQSDHLINTYASKIRKKIREVGGPSVILAIKSIGFRLSPKE